MGLSRCREADKDNIPTHNFLIITDLGEPVNLNLNLNLNLCLNLPANEYVHVRVHVQVHVQVHVMPRLVVRSRLHLP